MHSIYTAGGFRLALAGADTDQAKTRPATFTGQGVTEKHTLTDAQYAAWAAESDPAKRTAILATGKVRTVKTGKVQVPTAAFELWLASIGAMRDLRSAAAQAEHEATEAARIAALPKTASDEDRQPVPVQPIPRSVIAAEVLSSGVLVIEAADEDTTDEALATLFPDD